MRLPSACTTAPTLRSPGRRWHAVTALAGLSLTMIASGCSLSGSSAATAAANDTTVTVAVVPGIDNATLELAQKDGLFTNAGIKVKIDAYATVSKEISALSSGTVDVAAGDYGDLFFAQATAPRPIYQIIADGYDAVPGVIEIMTLPGSRIKSPAQLAGQRIAAPAIGRVGTPTDAPNSLDIATATSVLQSFGVNLSVVHWENMTPAAELRALGQGHVPAILATEPYIYLAQRELGAVELVDACSGATAGIPLSGYFTTTSWARDNASSLAAFQAGLKQAAADASMPGPVQTVLRGYAGLTQQEAALVTVGTYPISTIAASLQRTADLMNTEGMIRYRLNVAAMIVR